MSDGPRIQLRQAQLLAVSLLARWGLWDDRSTAPIPGVQVVGSIRRQSALVGDVEIIAPLPPTPVFQPALLGSVRVATDTDDGHEDPLWETLQSSLLRASTKADPPTPPLAEMDLPEGVIGRLVSGGKPHFRAVNTRVLCGKWPGRPEVGVQVYRYARAHRGWCELMRTGPAEFGKWFLARWAVRYSIPRGRKASHEGALRNARGEPVTTPTEEDCFRLAGLPYVSPQTRDSFIQHARAPGAY